jgi:FemAB-related protein (PEP-CTERM system-associated)
VIEQRSASRPGSITCEQDGQIQGVLPLAEIKSRLFGHSLGAMPFCVYGGVAATTRRRAPAARRRRAQAGATAGRRPPRIPRHAARPPGLTPAWHTKELYVTFRKEITGRRRSQPERHPAQAARDGPQGHQAGPERRSRPTSTACSTAYAHSVHRLGTPVFPKKYFAGCRRSSATSAKCAPSSRRRRTGRRRAELLLARRSACPTTAAACRLARDVAGNDFMYWNLMQAAAARGCRIFDFGRSKLGTGAYDFKKNWGFTAQHLPYEYKLYGAQALPDNNPLNPKYQLFIKMWKKLPLPLANFMGPYIVKQPGLIVEDLLLLIHRIPYPPNKGDKIRSYHLLKHLAQHYRVHLATFVDDPDDWQYVPHVEALCASSHFARMNPLLARVRSLAPC